MSARSITLACALCLLAACSSLPKAGSPALGNAASAATAVAAPVARGTVQSVREVKEPSKLAALLGTIGGAALGGVAGANIGGGTGKIIAASVLSVISGNVGSTVASRFSQGKTHYEVLVRQEDGIDRTFKVPSVGGIKPGTLVGIDAKGALSALAASP